MPDDATPDTAAAREAFEQATERIHEALTGPKPEQEQQIIAARAEVLAQFGPLFTPERVRTIKEHELAAFLRFENNKHWSQLVRSKSKMTQDMDALRAGLATLVDASEPLPARMTAAVQRVTGMGKAIATAILQVAHPDTCGVWNTTSEQGLKALDLWPAFERGASVGAKYERINDVLVRLAEVVETDLWTLDALWGILDPAHRPSPNYRPSADARPASPADAAAFDAAAFDDDAEPAAARFGLERYLQEFLRDNWAQTDLAAEWDLYAEEGAPEAGFEYPVKVGYIDLLARHKTDARWLVIELKRGQTSDATLGQVLRYMGAVRRELADEGDAVEGLIIAYAATDKLRYAVSEVPTVALQLYDVSFHLRPDAASA